MVKNVTIIQFYTNNLMHTIYLAHEGPFGEVIENLRLQKQLWMDLHKGMNLSENDLFWHLSEYCRTQYGPCPVQRVELRDIIDPSRIDNHRLLEGYENPHIREARDIMLRGKGDLD